MGKGRGHWKHHSGVREALQSCQRSKPQPACLLRPASEHTHTHTRPMDSCQQSRKSLPARQRKQHSLICWLDMPGPPCIAQKVL